MKVGIMGGTFDPIHNGHLIAAERAREAADLDEIWFMPSNVPPHKPIAPRADARKRWEMVRLAIQGNPYFKATNIEMKLGGTSYTVNTMSKLTGQHPGIDFYYIIGADMVQYLPQWYQIDELMNFVGFIGLKRPGYLIDWDQLSEALQRKVTMVAMPMIEISSTEIRERRMNNRSIRYLVRDSVYDYIEVNRLYEA